MYDQAERLRNKLISNKSYAKTIAFASGKGGVGKSNTALNFAIELQEQNKTVLLFDLDIGMGNIDILLGNRSKYSIIDFFTDFMPIRGIIESGPKGLSYIAGGANLNDIVQLDEDKLDYFFEQYDILANTYDYIIFDLGAGVTSTMLSFILAADECFIITTPEPTAITDAYSLVKQVVIHNKLLPIRLIMNRSRQVKENKKSIQRFQQVVEQFLHIKIKQTNLLPDDTTVTNAVMHQTPYVLYAPRSAISKQLKQIVTEFLSESKENEEPVKQSFIQKLKQYLVVQGK